MGAHCEPERGSLNGRIFGLAERIGNAQDTGLIAALRKYSPDSGRGIGVEQIAMLMDSNGNLPTDWPDRKVEWLTLLAVLAISKNSIVSGKPPPSGLGAVLRREGYSLKRLNYLLALDRRRMPFAVLRIAKMLSRSRSSWRWSDAAALLELQGSDSRIREYQLAYEYLNSKAMTSD
jgi:hypothetical protein